MLILQEFRGEKPGWQIRGSQALGSIPKPDNEKDCKRNPHLHTWRLGLHFLSCSDNQGERRG